LDCYSAGRDPILAGGTLKGAWYRGLAGEYYSVDGYHLRNGLRAAIGEEG
jgi:hypothetical protein